MRTLFLVLCLTLLGCSNGSDTTGDGGGGHPFEDKGASTSGSGGAGGGTGGSSSNATTASAGGSGGGSSTTSSGTGGSGGSGGSYCGNMDDPDNCGACGRSCLGGACTNGLCDSTFIGGPEPTSLAVSSAAVIWGTSSGARAADLDGSSVRTIHFGVSVAVPGVAANADVTAFIVETNILLFDPTVTTQTLTVMGASPATLAADPGHVYWGEGGIHSGIYGIDTASHAVVELAYPTPGPRVLTAGDGLVCWTAFTTASNGELGCVPNTASGTGPGLLLKQALSTPCSIAVADGEVFWAECVSESSATVSEASDQDGSGFVGLSSAAAAVVATDGVYAYWADHGVFRRIEIASGVIEGRAVAPLKIDYLVAGPDRLYWSNSSGVYWVAK